MSHVVNIEAMIEQLFLLESIAYGSRSLCRSYGVTSFDEAGYQRPLSTWSITKSLVSQLLLDASIKCRILLDHVNSIETKPPKSLERNVATGLTISNSSQDHKKLSIRESLNKVIHATQVSIALSQGKAGTDNTYYWDGQVRLEGEQDGRVWVHQIIVVDWAKAVRRLVIALHQGERLEMLGWDGGF